MNTKSTIAIIAIIVVLIATALLFWKTRSPVPSPPLSNKQSTSAGTGKDEPKITPPSAQKALNTSAANLSAWVWDSPDIFTKDDLVKMFQLAQNEKITMIYLRMDDYAYIYGMKNNGKKTTRIKKLNNATRQFITLAREYGIKVQALGGDTGWADTSERSYPNHFFDGVLNYNNSNPKAQFVGIQFDVESNNSAAYKTNKTQTLANYLDFVREMVNKKPKNTNFAIGFTLPLLYGRQDKDVILNWQNYGSKLIAYHVFDILNRTSGGYAVLMDYRNYAAGKDGSIENAQNEIEYIFQNSPNIKIIIGQETTKVSPSKITFYDTSKQYFKGEVAKIINVYAQYPEFAGIAIHHLQSYIDL